MVQVVAIMKPKTMMNGSILGNTGVKIMKMTSTYGMSLLLDIIQIQTVIVK